MTGFPRGPRQAHRRTSTQYVRLSRLHVETACRRGGVLALAPEDLDPEDCLIQLQATLGLVEAVKAHAVLESGSVTWKVALTV